MQNNSTDDYRYYGSLSINDISADIPLSTTSFIIKDSINELYPKVNFTINDEWGTMNEYLAFIDGSKISLSFGKTKETQIKNDYRVFVNGQPIQNSQNYISGKISVELIHDYYYYQNKISKSYQNNISDIIKSLVNKYKFSKLDIDTTYNSGLWIQPYMSDAEFIINNLLPYSYSTDSNNSPFYCWIDNNNVFHFKSYKQLCEQKAIRKYEYTSLGENTVFDENSILTVNFLQDGMNVIKPLINQVYGYYNKDGDFVNEQNLKMKDFPKNKTSKIPIIADASLITDVFENLDDDMYSEDNENNRKGYINNRMRNSFCLDKVLISTNIDPQLHSGQLVNIKLPMMNGNNSQKQSGDYIIETCYHKWNGKQGVTILVCARQRITVNGDYKFRNYMI